MRFVIGSKQTTKMVEQGLATQVYVAQDTDPRLKNSIVRLCETSGVPIIWSESMKSLGETCGIEVGAAMAAVIPEIE
ncbi:MULTISPECIES: ribosomal L7Ae/L30e/S12e/Gadd45 family protein [Paenibacillus]|uniref:Ribosomal L7Ae/L30e/S12e/Gadd45 family protein n=1 Tax=Paenibacillus lignilyticus TaxID=1172615 RepID=A0ABS5CLJ1_9BACL|nr:MULTISPECIES: ribosomal L7Ae/L30e/S12e/Gadd45 family protein [Paenibacillus]MBP3966733.1 ribosomal L7Ae/L30e/S12e/Gadd45 family protein [Paenibacillus lignilyticus]SFT28794.1 large subunit ribosomal protein L7A [Paenibacillus sp. BC26]